MSEPRARGFRKVANERNVAERGRRVAEICPIIPFIAPP
jgi:hypothetical protein